MIIYLAGGVSGNLKPAWKTMARKYKADSEGFLEALQDENFWRGGESRHWIHMTSPIKENDETVHSRDSRESESVCSGCDYSWQGLPRGGTGGGYDPIIRKHKPYILESFYYVDEDTERLLPFFGDFLLDSGAFTFMMNTKCHVNWDEYIERYAAFIKKNRIEKFFELDIDSVVGYKKVLEYRKRLESLTGRQCIPVWHKSRGIKEYERMCEEYDYAAIGGIVSKEIKPEHYSVFPKMIKMAHEKDCKIHGLGFTSLAWLPKCHFDSVDSTAWTTGNRFGFLYRFDGKTMKKTDVPKGKRFSVDKSREVALHNYTEWIKFQKWAETHL